MKAAKNAFDASIDGGITFFDTAEVYGSRVRKSRLIVPLLFCFTQIDAVKILGNPTKIIIVHSCRLLLVL